MAERPLGSEAPPPRPRVRWIFVLLLLLAAGGAVLAYAGSLPLHRIGQTFSSVRNSSLDTALEAKARGALALSRRVSGLKVDLQAHAGRVTLAGRVPTQEARSIIEAIVADTPGVAGVDNQLVVDPGAAASGYEMTLLQRISDLETQVAVQERLRHEPLLASADLKVSVERGDVLLRGWVEGDRERSAAQEIAQSAVGAEHVRNELKTLSTAGGGEERLASRVEFELYSSGAFDLAQVRIHSQAGRVQLEGSVRSEAERLLAARLAGGVPGVKEVVNDLKLATAPPPAPTV
jgi:hyperosmotically inducible protein